MWMNSYLLEVYTGSRDQDFKLWECVLLSGALWLSNDAEPAEPSLRPLRPRASSPRP